MIQDPGSRRVGALTRQPLLSSRLLVLVLMQCEAGSCGRVAAVSGHSVWLGWAGWAAGSDKIQVLEQAAAASQHQITRLMETRRH